MSRFTWGESLGEVWGRSGFQGDKLARGYGRGPQRGDYGQLSPGRPPVRSLPIPIAPIIKQNPDRL
jgi:hypothetical protein